MKQIALVFTCMLYMGLSYAQSEKNSNHTMNSYIAIFEIPATDISRAITFYQNILDLDIQELEFPGMHMGLFPTDNQMNTGVILKAEDYIPSSLGVTIYFHAGDDLQRVLDKIEENGGRITVPKTAHADGNEFFAMFIDSEGNRMGLHSPN